MKTNIFAQLPGSMAFALGVVGAGTFITGYMVHQESAQVDSDWEQFTFQQSVFTRNQ